MYKKALFACDLSKDHYELCQRAIHFSQAIHAELRLLYVIEVPASLQLAQGLGFAELASPNTADAEAVMKSLGEAFDLPSQNLHVEIGLSHKVIVEKARLWQSDLLILGRHLKHPMPAFLGSTAKAIAQHPPCDILTMGEQAAVDANL